MNNGERRKNIIVRLNASNSPISASALANEYSVTRQIIVADIALLRASGYPIRAEHKGYVLDKENTEGIVKRIVVQHGKQELQEELYSVVDNGGKVLDVKVEHSVYGQISGELNLNSRYDVDNFIRQINETKANPLSLLTEGLHIHTLVVKDERAFEAIVEKLAAMGILIEYA
ncbi:MAG: transcription repressor NadR [Clostridia bacterium]|nr:transcription repressor NadR [Clostridia bacterium]